MKKKIAMPVRKDVMQRDNGCCQKCGRSDAISLHHIQAESEGGLSEPENLIALCYACHTEWHSIESRTIIKFDQWLDLPSLSELIMMLMSEYPDSAKMKDVKEAVMLTHRMMVGMRGIEDA